MIQLRLHRGHPFVQRSRQEANGPSEIDLLLPTSRWLDVPLDGRKKLIEIQRLPELSVGVRELSSGRYRDDRNIRKLRIALLFVSQVPGGGFASVVTVLKDGAMVIDVA